MVRQFYRLLFACGLTLSCSAQFTPATSSFSQFFHTAQFNPSGLLDGCYDCDGDSGNTRTPATDPDVTAPAEVASPLVELTGSDLESQHEHVNWEGLGKASSLYLGIMHSYRIA